ncbi:MAG: hypothetical protein MJ091_01245 [Clostridia bacterium]|nr:hypothetical protein [Clostridia bacterium]
MCFADVMKSVFEFALVSFGIWAVFHEDVFVEFENRVKLIFRRAKRIKTVNSGIREF